MPKISREQATKIVYEVSDTLIKSLCEPVEASDASPEKAIELYELYIRAMRRTVAVLEGRVLNLTISAAEATLH